jgi:hypothetical protein
MDISYNEIDRFYKKNILDKFIYIKNSLKISEYYKRFCNINIKISSQYRIKAMLVFKEYNNKFTLRNEPLIYSIIQPSYRYYQEKDHCMIYKSNVEI